MGLWKRGQTLNMQLCSISKCKHSNAILHLKHYLVCTAWTQLSHDGAAHTLINLAGHAPPNKTPTHTAWIWESCQAQKHSYWRSCKSLNAGTNTCHDNWGKPQTDTRTNVLKYYMSGSTMGCLFLVFCWPTVRLTAHATCTPPTFASNTITMCELSWLIKSYSLLTLKFSVSEEWRQH